MLRGSFKLSNGALRGKKWLSKWNARTWYKRKNDVRIANRRWRLANHTTWIISSFWAKVIEVAGGFCSVFAQQLFLNHLQGAELRISISKVCKTVVKFRKFAKFVVLSCQYHSWNSDEIGECTSDTQKTVAKAKAIPCLMAFHSDLFYRSWLQVVGTWAERGHNSEIIINKKNGGTNFSFLISTQKSLIRVN